MSYCCKCQKIILDKMISMADNRPFHTACLNCEKCYDTLINTYYIKNGMLLCKDDYNKIMSAVCNGCMGQVTPKDFVHKINCLPINNDRNEYFTNKILIYHPACLKCHQCQNFLKKGDKYIVKSDNANNNGIFCLKNCATDYLPPIDQTMPVPRKRNRQSNSSVKVKSEKLQNQSLSQFNQM